MSRSRVFLFGPIRLLALSLAASAWGACVAPKYRVGKELANDKSGAVVDISIRLEDFAPERLVCLAGAIRDKYPDRDIHAAIFSAYDAARNFTPGDQELTPLAQYARSKLHGSYHYDRNRGENFVFLTPDADSGSANSPFNTRIDLPLTGPPACRLALDGRCLLEFKHIDYPSVGGRTDGSGEVTVTGRIRPNGVVSELKAVETKADPPAWESTLKEFALRNLQTWRFATSSRESSLHITYHFTLTDSALSNDNYLQFQLPNEVRIQSRR
jgi:hypothetical protein